MSDGEPESEPARLKDGLRNRPLSRALRSGDSYGLLLISLVLLFLLISFGGASAPARLVTNGFASIVMLLGLHTSHVRGSVFRIAVVAAALNLVAATLAATMTGRPVTFVSLAAAALLMFLTPIAVLKRIFSHRVVAAETILGAICVYLMIGCAFAFIYAVIGISGGEPVLSGIGEGDAPPYLYFSFVTLTTLGYGDLAPVVSAARTAAITEAVMGQLFLATIIARLVASFRRPLRSEDAGLAEAGERADGGESAGDETPEVSGSSRAEQ